MTASTTLQLKISRTKKRLSNNVWYLPLIILASAGLMIYLSSTLRAISMAGRYGLVEAEIPVLAVPMDEGTFGRFKEKGTESLGDRTPLLLLTRDAFIFGTLQAFATDLSSVRNKFYVPHEEGAPHLPRLSQDLGKWIQEKGEEPQGALPRVLIFIPTEDIPMPIVIQCLAALKNSGLFDKIIIGGGLV
jgi:hypothetical protein